MAPNNKQRQPRGNKTVIKDTSSSRKNVEKEKYYLRIRFMYIALVIVIAVVISIGHRNHLATQFENDRHFSHLSTLEREMAFRTEMGLYFSYFKTIITAPTFDEGFQSLMRDNITEYPSTINTLRRFNLYPEVFLGMMYRSYVYVSNAIGHSTQTCWKVNRGEGLSPVQSCEGLGEPAIFYTEAIFLLNGLMMGTFFLFGTYLSDTIFGGFITVACFMFNHGECTRVMWTPPLRESFGYPFFVFNMLLVTYTIKSRDSSLRSSLSIAFTQVIFMLSWQFAQFALLTQTLAVLGTYMLYFISERTFRAILLGQTIGLAVGYVFLFGNEMLLLSFFASSLFASWVLLYLDPYIHQMHSQIAIWLAQGAMVLMLMIGMKFTLGKALQVEDDAHISEILRSKFSDFQNFHTMLYTCAKEFDYIELETLWKLLKTLLLPSALFAFFAVLFKLLKAEIMGTSFIEESVEDRGKGKTESEVSKDRSKYGAEMVYHSLQLLAFTVMALLVMRLKLFWTPHLCLFTSLLASRQVINVGRKEMHMAVLAVLVAVMAWEGVANLKHQYSIMGEFSNMPQEELIEWIRTNTSKYAVFAGAMPTMATVKLCTLRPIVNHPHYEDAGLRARTKLVYSMYSRKPLAEVKANLDSLGVDYAIMEKSWCFRSQKPGCSMPEIWDIEDVDNREKQPACVTLAKKPGPMFERVFQNGVYHVFKLSKPSKNSKTR